MALFSVEITIGTKNTKNGILKPEDISSLWAVCYSIKGKYFF